jgi:hypothetical protein
MTVRQPLFQQNDATDQTADIFRLMLQDIVGSRHGIITETSFQVIQRGAGANNSVDVLAGGVIVPGTESGIQGYYYIVNDATVNVVQTAAHATLPRIDSVIVRARDSFYSGADNDGGLVYVAGTAASSPVEPNLDSLGYENYYRLANISVPANDNTITTADITDRRLTHPQGRAVVAGGLIPCTSTTRPTNPRKGQVIWESNTRQVLVNEGSSGSPSWAVYAVPGSGAWINYTPTITGLIGSSNTVYGRYFNMGSLVVGVTGFLIGSGGNVNAAITLTVPSAKPCSTLGGSNVTYIAVGRGFDSSAGTYYSATGGIIPAFSTTLMHSIATAGTGPWSTVVPFDWSAGDTLNMLFAYETNV